MVKIECLFKKMVLFKKCQVNMLGFLTNVIVSLFRNYVRDSIFTKVDFSNEVQITATFQT